MSPGPLHELAAQALAVPMASAGEDQQGAFLRAAIDVAAGGLLLKEGGQVTSEALYRAADAVVAGAAP